MGADVCDSLALCMTHSKRFTNSPIVLDYKMWVLELFTLSGPQFTHRWGRRDDDSAALMFLKRTLWTVLV